MIPVASVLHYLCVIQRLIDKTDQISTETDWETQKCNIKKPTEHLQCIELIYNQIEWSHCTVADIKKVNKPCHCSIK